MGQLIVTMFMTLDGVVQAPGEPGEDREGHFLHGGWQAPYIDEEQGGIMAGQYANMDALLLGRKTYDIFASYWPNAPEGHPLGGFNAVPKYVASRDSPTLEWNNSHLLEGDVLAAVERLKEWHEETHVSGSPALVQTLLTGEVIDRMNVWLYPLVLGRGKRFFGDDARPMAQNLVESKAFSNGVVLLAYEPAGAPSYGDLAWDAGQPEGS